MALWERTPFGAQSRAGPEPAEATTAPTPPASARTGTIQYPRGNSVVGPGAVTFSLHQDFRTAEKQRLEFRWELFNAANHAVWATPNTNANNSGSLGEHAPNAVGVEVRILSLRTTRCGPTRPTLPAAAGIEHDRSFLRQRTPDPRPSHLDVHNRHSPVAIQVRERSIPGGDRVIDPHQVCGAHHPIVVKVPQKDV